jgi:hypothetical protein
MSCCLLLVQVQEALLRVLHMMDSPQALFQPAVAGKVMMQMAASLLTWNKTLKSKATAANAEAVHRHGTYHEPGGQLQQLLGVAN